MRGCHHSLHLGLQEALGSQPRVSSDPVLAPLGPLYAREAQAQGVARRLSGITETSATLGKHGELQNPNYQRQ